MQRLFPVGRVMSKAIFLLYSPYRSISIKLIVILQRILCIFHLQSAIFLPFLCGNIGLEWAIMAVLMNFSRFEGISSIPLNEHTLAHHPTASIIDAENIIDVEVTIRFPRARSSNQTSPQRPK